MFDLFLTSLINSKKLNFLNKKKKLILTFVKTIVKFCPNFLFMSKKNVF